MHLSFSCLLTGFLSFFLLTPTVYARPDQGAAEAFLKRIVKDHAADFEISYIAAAANGNDRYELESKNNKIVLSGNNNISIASALNHYLRYYAGCLISWNGSNLKLPAKLPAIPVKVSKTSPYKYRYYLNYCTFNYSMSWWDWQRWQWEIDFMALNGINMPLAITGQNAVWSRVYKELGFTDKELENFFTGPAYFNWFYMGNIDGWGGPLPKSQMLAHEALQKKILERERSFGMTPILPAFTGHVPPAFKDKFPKAKLKKTNWTTFPSVYILDPEDELFTTIGKRFIEEEVKTFGTDHLYTADTFNENTPPTSDSLYLSNVSKKVYQSMALADPEATWIMQGWLFYHGEKFWKPTQIKALLNAIPNDKMIVLDLWSENHPVWQRTAAYYGKPWIWNMLHNFGGNISLYGRMDEVASGAIKAKQAANSGNMVGIGLTPEAIEQNPVMYQLMLDNIWTDEPINVTAWLKNYSRQRYGAQNALAEQAWQILYKTVYTGGILPGGPESILTGRPTMAESTRSTRPKKNYKPAELIPAWEALLKASQQLSTDGFKYDLVDVTRQVLVNYADTLQRQFAQAYQGKDGKKFDRLSGDFLAVMDDVDYLLATRKDFLLGKWLNEAKRMGTTAEEKKRYERNARNLITLWADQNSSLNEYSCRQWSGLISSFYKPRWQQFFSYAKQQLKSGAKLDQKVFEEKMKRWEWDWVNKNDVFTEQPSGNEIKTAESLYKKYIAQLKKTYN
ncbi:MULTISPECIES: alpha-N-acetylglucosaminidase [Pedobacter]|uniref:Alpha-N-acetylglucosaminidase n=1 Tax=Pedobacter heparinus (strain ATCC 13125 / DSM 2366 / CIP 104194 / JCM 7457 / NBRC 12017 / NCIMB 9290 / NRRL B-14731 / HIM 762-3) TaxID=485917 RepID=C6XUW8_PEDHD|nr:MULTISPECIES: alpha-N-acetylglucosaminidase [Pedobacter]ACU05976.1 Alpha-N-acetylglucosaminidase [Pedobacter heparinus DSM 2366]MBB5438738.1 alpha-N-acetylglucosaminidase [Pedobacter sp. AK017]